ncbi:MAG: hydrogenase maturation nickel metallochaperone HypA [Chitinispirillaceae bacterium]|jgi:hydrogenase nickel incorporation protein HypA/HybF
MHEYGVALEIVRMATERAEGRKITKVILSIGDLSGVFGDSLLMYCDLLFRDAQPSGEVLFSVKRVNAAFRCSCGATYTPAEIFDSCPACGGFDRTVIDGNQCIIESIEVDNE